jgi:hypothetical protein
MACFPAKRKMIMAPYNEIFDLRGAKRTPYAGLEARTGINLTQPPPALIKELGRGGGIGHGVVYPVPLILDEREYNEVLVPGVLQRAFMLQELFADIAMGFGKIVEAGLLTEGDLRHVLLAGGISLDSLRRLWHGQKIDQIRFVYGPDLVRDTSGHWVVLEDNLGCVGGVADGPVVLRRYLEVAGLPLHPSLTAESNLETSLLAFLHRVGLARGDSGLYGIAGNSECSGCNFQTALKADTLRSLGAQLKGPQELSDLIVARAIHPSAIINLATTLGPIMERLAISAFQNQDTPIFGAPCTDVVAFKSFHVLGESLVSLYLDEKALLPTPKTHLVREPLLCLPNDGVLKRANGCGGTEVFFLDEVLDKEALLEELEGWGPCGAVIQDQVNRSVISAASNRGEVGASVELRPIIYVYGWRAAAVDRVVTGRAIPPGGDRRGNISRGAQFLPVLLERGSG